MAGLGLFFHKSALALAPRGLLNLHKKVQGIAKGPRAVLIRARSYTQKTFLGPPREALVMPFSMAGLGLSDQNRAQATARRG
jgi:hypothetical protein